MQIILRKGGPKVTCRRIGVGRTKTSALLLAGPFHSASPCAEFEPFVARR